MRTVSLIFVTFGFISCFVQAQPAAPSGPVAISRVFAEVCGEGTQCSYNLLVINSIGEKINQKIASASCDAATTPDGAYSFKKGTTKDTILITASPCGRGAYQTLNFDSFSSDAKVTDRCVEYYGTTCDSPSE